MALQTKRERGVAQERARCHDIVWKRRVGLEHALLVKSNASNARDVKRMIRLLMDLERAILEAPEREQLPPVPPGDFSIEEMERAQDIIAEQELNPFEV